LIPKKEREKMIDFKAEISVSKQCKVLNLNRNFLFNSPKGESEKNLKIMFLLDKLYFVIPFYGYRKITVWMQNQGFNINEKRVRRLMKLVNWNTIYREPKTTICNPEHKKYPYLLKDLKITHKNQVWATDITYIPMKRDMF
jgi:putative transposase